MDHAGRDPLALWGASITTDFHYCDILAIEEACEIRSIVTPCTCSSSDELRDSGEFLANNCVVPPTPMAAMTRRKTSVTLRYNRVSRPSEEKKLDIRTLLQRKLQDMTKTRACTSLAELSSY